MLSDRILINAGAPGASIVALKKTDGSLIWKSQRDEAGYSSAVLHEIGGVRQAIYFTGQRALGVDVDTGQAAVELQQGRQQHRQHRDADRPRQPRVPVVRLRHRRGAARDVARDRRHLREEVYFTREMRNHHASSVLVGDYLYGFSDAILTAMQFDTGKVAWRDRSVGKGSVVFADDRLYLYSENGVVGLAEANPDRLPRARPLRAAHRQPPDVEPPGRVGTGSSSSAIRTTVYAFDVDAQVK